MSDDRKLIPIYDDTAPIACTLGPDEIPARRALLERLRGALTSVDSTETGLALHFPGDDVVRSDVVQFAADEKRCCAFWGFDVTDATYGITLRWDAPPDAAPLLATIETYLRTDAPISTLDGLF